MSGKEPPDNDDNPENEVNNSNVIVVDFSRNNPNKNKKKSFVEEEIKHHPIEDDISSNDNNQNNNDFIGEIVAIMNNIINMQTDIYNRHLVMDQAFTARLVRFDILLEKINKLIHQLERKLKDE